MLKVIKDSFKAELNNCCFLLLSVLANAEILRLRNVFYFVKFKLYLSKIQPVKLYV